ncbi:NAD(P)/FAD-dependent oxidoreductase [Herbaspirillum sp. CF444]|uniref:NAD(P)/FAD-dependent oxidoreductase n=1 Tax=Herbaspirillum sp. CF444 TaxID=1144319 RepID=UPI00068E4128|nr:FAD-binding oxidoreductase [Herbaspirillum sp. CF444]
MSLIPSSSPPHNPSSRSSASRHVVIIGAGAIGAMSALHALDQGLQVTIVDPGTPGGEHASSYGNAGWLSSHSILPPSEPGVWKKVPGFLADPLGPLSIRWRYLPRTLPWLLRYLIAGSTEARITETAKALRTLLAGAAPLHQQIAGKAGVGQLIELGGLLHVYRSRQHFENDARGWRIRRAFGISWEELEVEELRRREPDLDPGYGFGVYIGEAGHCRNPGAYIAALIRHACDRGARLQAVTATGFRFTGDRLSAVCTEEGDIVCDAAVIAAGAQSKMLAAQAGDKVPLETERGYHAMVENPEGHPRTPMMIMDRKVIATQTELGLRVAGQVEIASFEAEPDWRRAEIMRDLALQLFPALPRDLPASRVRYWLGRRPSMPDGLPCIGPSTRSTDVIHAFGHGHIGLGTSARTGRLVAQLLTGQTAEIDLAPFSAQRF